MDEGRIIKDFTDYNELLRDDIWSELKGRDEEIKREEEAPKADEKIMAGPQIIANRKISRKESEDFLSQTDDKDTKMAYQMFYAEDRERGSNNYVVFNNVMKKLGGLSYF